MTTPNDSAAAGVYERDLAAAIDLLRRAQRVAAATHISPDPDATGSLLGLGHVLKHLGKQVVLLCDDPAPDSLSFLPGIETILATEPDPAAVDLFVGLDASDFDRLGKVATPFFASRLPTLIIDHHITNSGFGVINLVKSSWSATSEGLVEIFDSMEVEITAEAALCLLAGLVGDTRGFSTANTTAASLRAGATLIAAGGDIRLVNEALFQQRTFKTLRLWGIGLVDAALEDGVCWAEITADEIVSLATDETSSSGLSNLLISVEEAKIAAVFTEQADGTVDASFRARPGYDVASVALGLGGGGHELAAGVLLQGPIHETVKNTVNLLKMAAQRNRNN